MNKQNYAKRTQFSKKSNVYNLIKNNELQRKNEIGHLVKTNPNEANFTRYGGQNCPERPVVSIVEPSRRAYG